MMLRILRFLFVAGLAAALALVSQPLDLFHTAEKSSAIYQVSAKDLQITCNGSAILSGGTSGTSTSNFKRTGSALVGTSYSAASATTLDVFGNKYVQGFGVRQDLSSRIGNPDSLTVLDKTGTTVQGSALLTANQIQLTSSKGLKGLLGAPCLRPQSEFWFVGGATTIGREALLVLHNPSPVDATVDLEIFTENGPSHSAGLSGISVRAGKTTVLPLAAFVLRASSLTVHVRSHGGSITALIQQKAVRGLNANGADYIAPSETFTKDSYFPGILVRGALDAAKYRKRDSKYADVQNVLRVFVPGSLDAKITFQVLGTDAQTFGTVLSVTAPAGKVTDFDIPGLQDGDYFGILNSSVQVRSAVRLVRTKYTGDKFVDFAWINSAATFDAPRYIAVPAQGISKLSITNPTNKPTTVALKIGSATIQRHVAANSTEVIRASAGIGIGLIPQSSIAANLVVDLNGRIAVLPVLDDKNISGQVQVSVH